MLIKIILIVLGVFVYLLIGGILAAHFNWYAEFIFWPAILIVTIPYWTGQAIYEWYEKKRTKRFVSKLRGGEKE